MMPRVSVVVATRNRRRSLGDALASINAQTFRDFEIIVVDDGSTDGTVDWLRTHFPSICPVVLGVASGAAAARNRGLEHARGEIVAFLDDDDTWHPSYLETQVAQFDAHPDSGLCSTGHIESDGAGQKTNPDLRPLFEYTDPLVHLLAECPLHTLSLVACRRQALIQVGPFDETLAIVHDLDWFVRFAAAGGKRQHASVALVERGVPGSLVAGHRKWYREERSMHRRAFGANAIAPADRRRIRATRAVFFARVGLAKGDLGFGFARIFEALWVAPLDSIRMAVLRLRRRRRRPAAEAWSQPPLQARATLNSVLQTALALAVSPTPAAKPAYVASAVRAITRRGVFWLGQTCNLRCHFCYFLDRIENDHHPEHAFISLDKAKEICRTLVEYYGNNSVDIQGGEPTLFPGIYELVAYCAEIGLSPTIITNAQVLSNRAAVTRLRQAGLRDFLVSLQGLGTVYDELVGRPGAHIRQMKALHHMQEEGIPFRFNTVLSRPALVQLSDIAKLAVRTGAEVVNFLGFNPFNDQHTGKRSSKNVPRYGEISGPLNEALDLLAAAGIEANVRYLPLCVVAERHRPSVYDFPQIPYDLHENDFASWSWTDLPAQRMRNAALTPPFGLGPRLPLGPLRAPLRRLASQTPLVADALHDIKQRLERRWASRPMDKSLTELYQRDARTRAREYTGYRHVPACESCDLQGVCDGFYSDYTDLFGDSEARPITIGERVADPQYYSKYQQKRIHPQDMTWLEGGEEAACLHHG